MFDTYFRQKLDPLSEQIITWTRLHKLHPTTITITGFSVGCLAAPLIVTQNYLLALPFILGNRILDGFDGLIAKRTGKITALGGYLDITLDFIFYALVAMSFGLAATENTAPALILLFSFMGCGTCFLAHGLAVKELQHPAKTYKLFDYVTGFAEGGEVIFFFTAFCLFPQYFPTLALIFATLCILTIIYRTWHLIQQVRE